MLALSGHQTASVGGLLISEAPQTYRWPRSTVLKKPLCFSEFSLKIVLVFSECRFGLIPKRKSAVRTGKLEFEGFRLDPANARLWRGDDPIALAPKPFEVLCRLVERAGELVTKDELLDTVWSNLHVSEFSLSVAISTLRSALGDDPNAPRYIQTVSRRGYRFISSVTPSLESEQPWAAVPAAGSRPRWLVGRTAALENLESALQQSLAGNRQLVFITGEAGIGKTTLVEMAMERMSRYGLGVLWGHCIELFGTDEAFLPLIEALQESCCGADGASRRHAIAGWR